MLCHSGRRCDLQVGPSVLRGAAKDLVVIVASTSVAVVLCLAVVLPGGPSLDVRVAGTITVPRRAVALAPKIGALAIAVTARASTFALATTLGGLDSSSFI